MEPTANDVNAVAAGLGIPEQVPAQPAQQQPAEPTPQAAPSQEANTPAPASDPFADLFSTPAEPAATPAAPAPQEPAQVTAQPSEPVTPQPAAQPAEPVATPAAPAPAAPAAPAPPAPQTAQEYIDSLLAGIGEAPAMPDIKAVDPNDEAAIGQFFNDLMTTAEKRFETKFATNQAIQTAEKAAWEASFDKYPSLRSNTGLRDTVHAIRRASFDKGVAMTPTQAAEELLTSMGANYRRGVADSAVHTTIVDVQPTGGNTQPVPTTLTEQNVLEAVQTGGEAALEQFLNQQIDAGKL